MSETKQIHLTRPQGRSLQEYKEWVLETGRMIMGPDFQKDMTNLEWEKGWKGFWSKEKESEPH